MTAEVNQAKRYLGARFGYGEHLPPGEYAVPTDAARGLCFMKVRIEQDGTMGGFNLFWDEACTMSYHEVQLIPSELPPESQFAQAFRALEACPSL